MSARVPATQVPIVDLDEAVARVAARAGRAAAETVAVGSARGRVLAADLEARSDLPAADVSAMDGYACRAEDTASATQAQPVRLRLVGEVPAGHPGERTLAAGEAVAVFTGAPIPRGADAVVRLEATRREGDDVDVLAPATPRDIRPRGDQLRRGETYLRAGTLLDPRALGLAAAMGHATVRVARRPRVALLVTGDELVEPGAPLPEGGAYDASGTALAAMVTDAGGTVALVRRVPDDPAALRAALAACADTDLVLTSGGASVGRHDVVKRALENEGRVHFGGVRVKPGAPVTLGEHGGRTVLALPGNPAAAWLLFGVLGSAWFHRHLGRLDPPPYLRRVPARAAAPFGHGRDKAALWPARVLGADEGGVTLVEPWARHGGGGPAEVALADALVLTQPWQEAVAGARVEVVPWE